MKQWSMCQSIVSSLKPRFSRSQRSCPHCWISRAGTPSDERSVTQIQRCSSTTSRSCPPRYCRFVVRSSAQTTRTGRSSVVNEVRAGRSHSRVARAPSSRHPPPPRHPRALVGPPPLDVEQRRRRPPHPLRPHHPVVVLRHLHAPDGHLAHQTLVTAPRPARPQLVPIHRHHPIRPPRPPGDRLAPTGLPIERGHQLPLLGQLQPVQHAPHRVGARQPPAPDPARPPARPPQLLLQRVQAPQAHGEHREYRQPHRRRADLRSPPPIPQLGHQLPKREPPVQIAREAPEQRLTPPGAPAAAPTPGKSPPPPPGLRRTARSTAALAPPTPGGCRASGGGRGR